MPVVLGACVVVYVWWYMCGGSMCGGSMVIACDIQFMGTWSESILLDACLAWLLCVASLLVVVHV